MPSTFTFEEATGMAPPERRGSTFTFEEAMGRNKPAPPEEMAWYEKAAAKINLPDWMDNLRGSTVYSVAHGMAKPVVGAVQAVANTFPNSTGIPQAANARIADIEARKEAARASRGREGTDFAESVGEVFSPANLAIAARAPIAATAGMRALQGAAIGGGTAAMQPITDADEGDFWGRKAMQVGAGTVTGAALAPAIGAIADRAVRFLRPESIDAAGARASLQTDFAIKKALQEAGQSADSLPPDAMAALRSQVLAAMRQGRSVDAAAMMRRADFDALGIKPTLGQITRDPNAYADEKNLSTIGRVGQPLIKRFSEQNRALRTMIEKPASGAGDSYSVGDAAIRSLKDVDDALGRHVSGLYREARQSARRELDVPLTGLAQDYAKVLDDFADKVPAAIRGKFAKLGLDPSQPSNQMRRFNLEDADGLLKVLNDHVGSDKATNTAIGRIRSALRSAVESADATGGPFAPAVKAARERFQLLDAVPALKAASEGSVAADDFVNRFIVNGKAADVHGLSKVLEQANPALWQEARAQMAESLKRAAFGRDPAGDAAFNAGAYVAQLRRLGPHKLKAFFSPQEIDDMMRVGRVGAYMRSFPSDAPVNTSKSAGVILGMLDRIPGATGAIGLGKQAVGAVKNQGVVKRSLAASPPVSALPPTADQQNLLRWILSGGMVAGGAAVGGATGR